MKNDRSELQARGNENQVLIRELVRPTDCVEPDIPVSAVKRMMKNDEVINSIVVASKGRPLGLVMNIHVDRILSQRYGVSLFAEQPVRRVMDCAPLIIEGDVALAEASLRAMQREPGRRFDHLIVVEGGTLLGVVSVQGLLIRMSELQKQSVQRMDRINERLQEEIRQKKIAEADLRNLNRDLEQRVERRTTELVRSNEALEKAKNAAVAANVAKSDFLANMSHELRTPLNHIIGFTELVLGRHFGPLSERQVEYLGDVLSSSRHLLSLINDILDLSKVEAGKMQMAYSDIDMKRLLEGSLVMIKEKAMKHRIALSVRTGALPDTFQADERKMKQIVYNLLSNALKFTPDGGRIQVSAAMAASGDPKLPAPGKATDYLLVSVVDTGIGIKGEDIERIFDPFEQGDGSRSRMYQGTGLGLSLTRKLVEKHQGRLWAESEGEGRGAAFRFAIPLHSTAAGPSGMAQPAV